MSIARSVLAGAAVVFGLSSTILASCPHPCMVIDEDFPDPSFLRSDNGSYYAFATMASSDNFVQFATSPDFYSWEVVDVNPLPIGAGWETDKLFWGPHVTQRVDGKFVLYYSAQVAVAEEHHCVGTAVADEPDGPYIPLSEPFACNLTIGGAIDASSFIDSDGSNYVLYKVDGNSLGNGGSCGNTYPPIVPTPIMLQEVEADGTTVVGDPVEILDRDDDDGPLIEAPNLVLRDDIYYLFYSSNCDTSSEYNIRYATSRYLSGPFTKAATPLLSTGDWDLNGPGGATVSGNGDIIMFHANCDAGRCSFVGELSYDEEVVSVL